MLPPEMFRSLGMKSGEKTTWDVPKTLPGKPRKVPFFFQANWIAGFRVLEVEGQINSNGCFPGVNNRINYQPHLVPAGKKANHQLRRIHGTET